MIPFSLFGSEQKRALWRSVGAITCAVVLMTFVFFQKDDSGDPLASAREDLPGVATAPDNTKTPVVAPLQGVEETVKQTDKDMMQHDTVNAHAYGIESEEPINIAGEYYLLQFGVFGTRRNAETLQQELSRMGLKARIESRVVVGPYLDRAAAETARDSVIRAGNKESIVVAARGRK